MILKLSQGNRSTQKLSGDDIFHFGLSWVQNILKSVKCSQVARAVTFFGIFSIRSFE